MNKTKIEKNGKRTYITYLLTNDRLSVLRGRKRHRVASNRQDSESKVQSIKLIYLYYIADHFGEVAREKVEFIKEEVDETDRLV